MHRLLGRCRNVLVFHSSHNNYHKLIGFRTIYIYYLMVWPSEVGMNFTGLDQGVDRAVFFPGGSRREYVFLPSPTFGSCPIPLSMSMSLSVIKASHDLSSVSHDPLP